MEAPGFWDDPDSSNRKMKELKNLKDTVETIEGLFSQYEDIETLIEMGYEEDDEQLVSDIRKELDEFISVFENIRIGTLLSDEYDGLNAILKLNAGAGGTESCDWCSMLYRMYTRWAERKGFSVEEGLEQNDKHFGLTDMQDRVSLLNGNMDITSACNKGTELKIEIPLI